MSGAAAVGNTPAAASTQAMYMVVFIFLALRRVGNAHARHHKSNHFASPAWHIVRENQARVPKYRNTMPSNTSTRSTDFFLMFFSLNSNAPAMKLTTTLLRRIIDTIEIIDSG